MGFLLTYQPPRLEFQSGKISTLPKKMETYTSETNIAPEKLPYTNRKVVVFQETAIFSEARYLKLRGCTPLKYRCLFFVLRENMKHTFSQPLFCWMSVENTPHMVYNPKMGSIETHHRSGCVFCYQSLVKSEFDPLLLICLRCLEP